MNSPSSPSCWATCIRMCWRFLHFTAIAVALNLFSAAGAARSSCFGAQLHIIMKVSLLRARAWRMAFLIPGHPDRRGLIVLLMVLPAPRRGLELDRLENCSCLVFRLGSSPFCCTFLFYLGFSSQAGGILPSYVSLARRAIMGDVGDIANSHLCSLLYFWRGARLPANWKLGLPGYRIRRCSVHSFLGRSMVRYLFEREFVLSVLTQQGMDIPHSLRHLPAPPELYRWVDHHAGCADPALSFLFPRPQTTDENRCPLSAVRCPRSTLSSS